MRTKRIHLDDLLYEYEISDDGTIRNLNTGRKLRVSYIKVNPELLPTMYLKDSYGKRLAYPWNELVMMHFHPLYLPHKTIYHKDGKLYHCNYENLTYERPKLSPKEYLSSVLHETVEWRKIRGNYAYEYYISEDGRLFNGTYYWYESTYYHNGKELCNLHPKENPFKVMRESVAYIVASTFIINPYPDSNILYFKNGNPRDCHRDNILFLNSYEWSYKNLHGNTSNCIVLS